MKKHIVQHQTQPSCGGNDTCPISALGRLCTGARSKHTSKYVVCGLLGLVWTTRICVSDHISRGAEGYVQNYFEIVSLFPAAPTAKVVED